MVGEVVDKAISAFNQVEVEVEAQLGNFNYKEKNDSDYKIANITSTRIFCCGWVKSYMCVVCCKIVVYVSGWCEDGDKTNLEQ